MTSDNDSDLVTAVVPVNPKIIPDNVTAGDYVNISVGIEGNVSQLVTAAWGGAASSAAWDAPPVSVPTPTPVPFTATLPLTLTPSAGSGQAGPLLLSQDVPEVTPPFGKLVLPQVQVIHVAREKVPDPKYGMTFGRKGRRSRHFWKGTSSPSPSWCRKRRRNCPASSSYRTPKYSLQGSLRLGCRVGTELAVYGAGPQPSLQPNSNSTDLTRQQTNQVLR